MSTETQKIKPNQIERRYDTVNGFEIRTGKFADSNEYLNGIKFEIRILHEDPELVLLLLDKIKEWCS